MSEIELLTNDIQPIISEIGEVLTDARSAAVVAVNTTLLESYWKIGEILVRYEQKTQARASYGANTLTSMAKILSEKYGKGFSRSNLQYRGQEYQCLQRLPIPESHSPFR